MSNTILQVGNIFSLLVLAHFIADWVFQTHSTAMKKSKDWKILGLHSLVYSCLMTWACWLVKGQPFALATTGQIFSLLFVSHFIEDTYMPVYLWAKYIRRVPQILERYAQHPKSGQEAFIDFAKTPLGCILVIAIDQIIHITVLVPIAYLLVK